MDSSIHALNKSLELYEVDQIIMSPAMPIEFQGFTPFILTGSPLEGCNDSFFTDMSSLERSAYILFALLSILTSISVALTIFYNPKLRVHPSKLIGYMCMTEAASCFTSLIWVINPKNYICYFGLHYLFFWTTG